MLLGAMSFFKGCIVRTQQKEMKDKDVSLGMPKNS